LENVTLVDEGADYPGRTQCGARWNHVGSGYEFSVSAFSGNNNLPIIEAGTRNGRGASRTAAASLAANAVPSGLQVPSPASTRPCGWPAATRRCRCRR